MAYPTSASFETQRKASANVISDRLTLFFGDYGLIGQGSSWSVAAVPALLTDQSLHESEIYSANQLGVGRREHRNFGDVEGTGTGIGWKGAQKSKAAGTFPGVLVRNLDTPNDGTKNNNGKRLAQRFVTPTPGGGVLTVALEQIRMRMATVGSPGATDITIYSDVAGLPGVAVAGPYAIVAADVVGGWVYINTGAPGLAVSTNFWIVLDTVGTAANHWTWAFVNSSTGSEFAAERPGVPWVAQTYRLHFSTVFSWTGSPKAEFARVNFGTDRRINTCRIYGYPSTRILTGQAPQTMKLRRKSGATYIDVNVTALRASDYAEPDSVATFAGAQISSATASYYEATFDTVTTDGFEVEVTKVQLENSFAQILAIEFYDSQDITDRINAYDTSARRDTLLRTDQAGDFSATCGNRDRFFSRRYNPTAQQVAAGFKNSEIGPELEVRVEAGFSTPERVPLGSFYLDAVGVKPISRTASIRGRDFAKRFETTKLSEPSAQGRRIEDLIELCANRANWSSSRYFPAETENVVPFFFPAGTSAREEIDKLAEAAPFGTVRFDERGDLRFLTYLPSTSSANFLITGNSYYLGIGPPDRGHALPVGEKVYLSAHEVQAGPDDVALLEYDIPSRTYRQLTQVVEVNATSFGQFAKDGAFLFWTYGNFARRIDLTALAVISLDVSALVAGFTGVGFSNSWGQVVAGRYYFVVSDAANTILCSVTTALVGFTNHGNIAPTTDAVGRIIRWDPAGVTDRLVWTIEQGAHTQTHWDLLTASFGNDGVTRRGVATDGPLLYELTSGNVLRSRDVAGGLSTIDSAVTATPGTGQNGTGIAFASGRLWMSWRDATRKNILRVYNLVDLAFFDIQIPRPFQRSTALEDSASGRLVLVSDSSEAVNSVPMLRVIQGPNAPTAASFEASYEGELLDADYEFTGENGGQNAIISGVRWVFNPVVLGNPTVVWRMTQGGNQLSATNRFTVPASTPAINLNETGVGGPMFKPIPASLGQRSVPVDIVGFVCPTAAGVVVFGPAISRIVPPGEPSLTTPQQVRWTGSGGAISATLTPHPTSPGLTLTNLTVTDNNLSMLEIVALPFVRLGMLVVEVHADEVLTDGASIVQRFGDNVLEIQNDYISDTALLKLAAFEVIRLYGRPQDQIRGVRLRPFWSLQREDVLTVVEPESGVNFRFVVLGIGHSRAAKVAHSTAHLMMLPVASTTGLGQSPNPPGTQVQAPAPE